MKLSFALIVLPVTYSLSVTSKMKIKPLCKDGQLVYSFEHKMAATVGWHIDHALGLRCRLTYRDGVEADVFESERSHFGDFCTIVPWRLEFQEQVIDSKSSKLNKCIYKIPGTDDTLEVQASDIFDGIYSRAFNKKCPDARCSFKSVNTYTIQVDKSAFLEFTPKSWFQDEKYLIDIDKLLEGLKEAEEAATKCIGYLKTLPVENSASLISAQAIECKVKFTNGPLAGSKITIPVSDVSSPVILADAVTPGTSANKCLVDISGRERFSLALTQIDVKHVTQKDDEPQKEVKAQKECIFRNDASYSHLWKIPLDFVPGNCQRECILTVTSKSGTFQLRLERENIFSEDKLTLPALTWEMDIATNKATECVRVITGSKSYKFVEASRKGCKLRRDGKSFLVNFTEKLDTAAIDEAYAL